MKEDMRTADYYLCMLRQWFIISYIAFSLTIVLDSRHCTYIEVRVN